MRARAQALLLLALILGLTAFPSAALATPPPAFRQGPMVVTMRLGISAGDAIQNVERGTDRRALERIIPELFEAAMALGVRIDAVSVGRGFWSEDGEVESENDLDLVVTGLRENVLALGATMGQRWGQSAVLAWEMTAPGDDADGDAAAGEWRDAAERGDVRGAGEGADGRRPHQVRRR